MLCFICRKAAQSNAAIGALNPLRYRGYVYDTETGLYYLQSRYYDPEIGRFINADAFTSTGQGLLGNNMFAYCGNNPVVYEDDSGGMRKPCTVAINDDGVLAKGILAQLIVEMQLLMLTRPSSH